MRLLHKLEVDLEMTFVVPSSFSLHCQLPTHPRQCTTSIRLLHASSGMNEKKVPIEQTLLELAAGLNGATLGCMEGRACHCHHVLGTCKVGVRHNNVCSYQSIVPARFEISNHGVCLSCRIGFSVWLNFVGTVLIACSVRQRGCPERSLFVFILNYA